MVRNKAMFTRPPSWVSPPPIEPGSIDPLGYQAQVDQMANCILPGVTVFTSRIRYLSFLCWALRETEGRESEIDRWDVALSVGEDLRHRGDGTCPYLGVRLIAGMGLNSNDALPARLHTPSARLRYMGLLRSCGFVDARNVVTPLGSKIAEPFGQHCPRRLPRKVSACEQMPCLSDVGGWEARRLREGLMGSGSEAATQRYKTFREVGRPCLRRTRQVGSSGPVLTDYLRSRPKTEVANILHGAAVLELEALPLTRLFHHLYRHGDTLRGRLPKPARLFFPYRLASPKEDLRSFLADVATHLHCAERMGRPRLPHELPHLKQFLIEKHCRAKMDGPWIDEQWRQLRKGLAPKADASVHGFRLVQFASLLSDLGEL